MIGISTIFNVCVGVGLSAACGFRVFVPLLALSIASKLGYLTLVPGFQWLSSSHAVIILSAATIVEIIGFFIPWVDHALDVIAAPLAILAGTVITAAVTSDMAPVFKWSLAVIAGGGVAATVHASTGLIRAGSTATTGGLANPLVSLAELIGAVLTSIASIFLPFMVIFFLLSALAFFGKKIYRKFLKSRLAV